ncbi:MAG: dUTP diphosphatase [Desulfovibrio sp.]|nr:MAG: dUTP diphosphatase [Desulfovibrio sp.]
MSRVAMRVKFLDPEPYGHAGEEFAPATSGSAGIDLRACIKEAEVVIEPGDRLAVPSGVAIEVMVPGVAGFVYSRSGLGAKDGVTVSQGVGVIDPDYRGEIKVFLTNTSKEPKTVTRGQRIAQLILQPFFRAEVEAVDELGGTDRGAGGFGHTGRM